MRPRLLALVAVLAVAASVVAGCGAGGGSDPVDPLARAATTTKDAGSARVALRGTVSAAGRRTAFDGDGAVDLRAGRARLELGTQLPAAGRRTVSTVFADGDVFVRTGGLAALLTGGHDWVKVDLARAAGAGGADLGALQGLAAGGDPSQVLALLALAADSDDVGAERVDGVETRHYAGRLDADAVAKVADPDLRRTLQRLGVRTIPVDAWLDDEGRVRRAHVRVAADGARVPVALDVTADLSDFGLRVDAAPPADAFDATAIAGTAVRLLFGG
jgi:hypothetical protein